MADCPGVDVQTSYDRVAEEYAVRIFEELAHKPLDRELLDRFAAKIGHQGTACDLGCGPGHVARYLHDRGTRILGVDLSPVMVETARRLNPMIEFAQGDMRSLVFHEGAFDGITAFYSIIHLPRPDLVAALAEMRRVLRPGGLLLLAFHIGDAIVHRDEWWGHPVSVDFIFLQTDQIADLLIQAGFQIVDAIERDPYSDVEYPSRRAYLFAETPVAPRAEIHRDTRKTP